MTEVRETLHDLGTIAILALTIAAAAVRHVRRSRDRRRMWRRMEAWW